MYSFILIFIGVGIFAVTDICLGLFDMDRYGLFASIFMYSPIGIILFSLSSFVKWKDEYKTTKRNYISITGIFLGSMLAILPPLLFWISSF